MSEPILPPRGRWGPTLLGAILETEQTERANSPQRRDNERQAIRVRTKVINAAERSTVGKDRKRQWQGRGEDRGFK